MTHFLLRLFIQSCLYFLWATWGVFCLFLLIFGLVLAGSSLVVLREEGFSTRQGAPCKASTHRLGLFVASIPLLSHYLSYFC